MQSLTHSGGFSSPGNLSLRPFQRVCQVVRRLRLASADAGRVTMITETITKIAIQVLDTSGYAGACALMTLESMIAPVPSEAVMPFVGFQVADGKWNLWLAIGSTSLGSIIGSLLSYWIGCFGGKPLVLKVGKYLLLNQRDLERTEQFFHRKSGILTIFIARFIPVVRHFISIPAGIGRTPMIPFLIVTFIGSTIWNTFLLVCGMKLRDHWPVVQKYSHQVDIGIVVVILIGALWWVKVRWPQFRAEKVPPGR
jgi:membrane protein DedA with SNARE-associated domain